MTVEACQLAPFATSVPSMNTTHELSPLIRKVPFLGRASAVCIDTSDAINKNATVEYAEFLCIVMIFYLTLTVLHMTASLSHDSE